MLGTIISVRNLRVTVAGEKGIYLTDYERAPEIQPGFICRFEEEKKPSLLFTGKCRIISCTQTFFESSDMVISKDLKVPDHKVLSFSEDPVIAGEGTTLQAAYEALADKAREYKANALLDFKADFKVKRLSGICIFRATALAGIVDGPLFHAPFGLKIKIDRNLARRNSPNSAMMRYIRVLAFCLLLICMPILVSFLKRGIFSPLTFTVAAVLFCGILLAAGVLYYPHRKSGYLILSCHRNSV